MFKKFNINQYLKILVKTNLMNMQKNGTGSDFTMARLPIKKLYKPKRA